jgi:MATE family multidrug resistance protein
MAENTIRPATLRSAFAIAWPASLAAVVTPVLGLTDTAVLARGADNGALAGAALAGAVFSLLYWTFGFLRMSLSGLSAQALGRNNEEELRAHLARGVLIGGAIGFVLLLLSVPIIRLAEWALVDSSNASPEAGAAMRSYIGVRILAAPFALMTTAILGWLSGQGRTRLLMVVTIGTATVNAGLSVLFVLGLDGGIRGLAAATALAELSGALLGAAAVLLIVRQRGGVSASWSKEALRRGWGAVLRLNRDIFIRTAILTSVIASFTRLGAGFDDVTVAANQVLLNLLLAVTLLLDGTAIAAEAFVGQALGAAKGRERLFKAAWQTTSALAGGLAVILSLALLLAGEPILSSLIGDGPGNEQLLGEALRFLPWVVAAPLAVATAFQLDGIYIGATRGPALRNSMVAAGLVYVAGVMLLVGSMGNHGLWAALIGFMLARGIGLLALWPGFARLLARSQTAAS